MSWSGSEKQRKEQGQCKPPVEVKKIYRVRANSPCQVRRISSESKRLGPWKDFTTTHANYFDHPEPVNYRRGFFVFRSELSDFEIMVSKKHVDIVSQ